MPLLSRELLDRLWLAWEQRGAALVGHLRPGLPSERIDELTAPLGLRLPIEARTWWEWHDGVDVRLGREGEMGPGLPFLPLASAVDLCLLLRTRAREVWAEDAAMWWRSSWFPFTDRNGAFRFDCAVEPGRETPIFYADSHDFDDAGLTKPRCGSFGALIAWWVEAIETGAWSYDTALGRWERRDERMAVDAFLRGVL